MAEGRIVRNATISLIICIIMIAIFRLDNIVTFVYVMGGKYDGAVSIQKASSLKGNDSNTENTVLKLVKKEVEEYVKDKSLDDELKSLVYAEYTVDKDSINIFDMLFRSKESFNNRIKVKVEIRDSIKSIKYKGKLKVENKGKARVIKVSDNKYILADGIEHYLNNGESSIYDRELEMEIFYNEIKERDNIIESFNVLLTDIK